MKRKGLWCFLLVLGIVPFAAPFLGFVYEMTVSSSWVLVDWLLFYSFVYWPTYVIGIILILFSVYKLRR